MERLVAIINTQGVLNDVVDSNIEILTEEGFVILDKKKLQLTPEQVARLNVPETEAILYSSGPVVVLLLAHETAFKTMNEIFPILDDIYYTHTTYLSLRDQNFLFPPVPLFERTLCVLKPGYTQEDLSLVVDALTEQGFIILGKLARVLPLDVAQMLSSTPEAANILASEVSVLFAVEKPNAIVDLTLLLGPEDPEEARLHAPYSIRARIGKDIIRNGAYCSTSSITARRDLDACFKTPFPNERSVLIVKNHALSQLGLIKSQLQFYNFTILAQDDIYFSPARLESTFSEFNHEKNPNFVAEMTVGPCVAFLVCRPSAVVALRMLVGNSDITLSTIPSLNSINNNITTTTLTSALFKNQIINGLELARDNADALRLMRALFPQAAEDRQLTSNDVDAFLNHSVNDQASLMSTLMEGLVELCRVKPQGNDAIKYLANWLLRHNPKKPAAVLPIVEEPETDIGLALHTPFADIVATKSNLHNQTVVVTKHTSDMDKTVTGLSITSPQKQNIIVGVASPGAASPDIFRVLATYSKLQYIHVPSLIQAAIAQNTDVSRVLAKHHKLGRPVPSHITVQLIKDALSTMKGGNILLAQSPLSLDDALELEAQGLKPHAFLLLTCSQDAAVTRLISAQNTPMLREQLESMVTTFIDEIQPVVEYYDSFKKLMVVDTDDTTATTEEIAQVASEQVNNILRYIEPVDKKPKQKRGPPRKPVPVSEEDR